MRTTICSILLTIQFLFAFDSDIGGYYKNFLLVQNYPEYEGILENSPTGSMNNTFRLESSFSPWKSLSFNFAYTLSPQISSNNRIDFISNSYNSDPSDYRIGDIEKSLYPSSSDTCGNFSIVQNLDRLYIRMSADFADLYIGRQPIAFGSARVNCPTDVIAPFTFGELDKEERYGVDAIRLNIPLGVMSEIDVGYVPGKNFKDENSAMFLRGKFYLAKTDFSLLGLRFREDYLLGFDLTRSLGGAGFWVENAFIIPHKIYPEQPSQNKEYKASIGVDYNFSGRIYAFCEYHYNGAGETDAADYLNNFEKTVYLDGATYLMGQHYIASGFMYQITPLITFSFQELANLCDPSVSATPIIEYNIAQDIYISLGAYLGIGKKGEINPSSDSSSLLKLGSEYGNYPDIYFSSFRIYF